MVCFIYEDELIEVGIEFLDPITGRDALDRSNRDVRVA